MASSPQGGLLDREDQIPSTREILIHPNNHLLDTCDRGALRWARQSQKCNKTQLSTPQRGTSPSRWGPPSRSPSMLADCVALIPVPFYFMPVALLLGGHKVLVTSSLLT